MIEKRSLNMELVEHLADAIEGFVNNHDDKVTNSEVVLALQYVMACTQRVFLTDKELN